MTVTRAGVQPKPQLAQAYPGNGAPNPAGGNPVASPGTMFLFVLTPLTPFSPNWS